MITVLAFTVASSRMVLELASVSSVRATLPGGSGDVLINSPPVEKNSTLSSYSPTAAGGGQTHQVNLVPTSGALIWESK